MISFLDFLDMHYTGEHPSDGDADRDMQLPFKSHDGCSGALNTASVEQASTGLPAHAAASDFNYSDYPDLFLKSTCLNAIWQPPKSC